MPRFAARPGLPVSRVASECVLRDARPPHSPNLEAAHAEWRAVADRLRERFPKLGALMDDAEDDVLAHLAFPKEHWPQLHSRTRSNASTVRSSGARTSSRSSPQGAIVELVGAMLLEQNDEWAASRARYMSLEKLAAISDDPQARPRPAAAA